MFTGRFAISVFILGIALSPIAFSASDPIPPAKPSSETQTEYEKPVDYSSKGTRVRLGGISVGAGYNYWSGPAWGPGYWGRGYWGPGAWGPGLLGPGAWSSMWWDPWFGPGFWPAQVFVHPGYWGGFGQSPGSGEVELRTPGKQDTVTIDGAFAGIAKDLKSFWLPPGVYLVGVSDQDGNSFERKIYVLSGKTLRLNAVLSSPPEEDNETREANP